MLNRKCRILFAQRIKEFWDDKYESAYVRTQNLSGKQNYDQKYIIERLFA